MISVEFRTARCDGDDLAVLLSRVHHGHQSDCPRGYDGERGIVERFARFTVDFLNGCTALVPALYPSEISATMSFNCVDPCRIDEFAVFVVADTSASMPLLPSVNPPIKTSWPMLMRIFQCGGDSAPAPCDDGQFH